MAPSVECFAAPTLAHHDAVGGAIHTISGACPSLCDPHAPWQRGGVENANGRIRVDLPRKTDLSAYTDDLVWIMNSTSRNCLGFRKPREAFAQQIGVALEM